MWHYVGMLLILFFGSFLIGTAVLTVKELISRKRAASEQNKKAEKEVDQGSTEK